MAKNFGIDAIWRRGSVARSRARLRRLMRHGAEYLPRYDVVTLEKRKDGAPMRWITSEELRQAGIDFRIRARATATYRMLTGDPELDRIVA